MPSAAPARRNTAQAAANAPDAPTADKPLLFLDFEASSLSPESWPVEIGFARIEHQRVEVASMIIRPDPAWSLNDWSEAAARIHGLSLDTVRAGSPAAGIAADTESFRDFLVVSDNPRWDQVWLDRLRRGRGPIEIHSLRSVAAGRLSEAEANAVALNLLRRGQSHRAGADAARLAGAWLAATRPPAWARLAA